MFTPRRGSDYSDEDQRSPFRRAFEKVTSTNSVLHETQSWIETRGEETPLMNDKNDEVESSCFQDGYITDGEPDEDEEGDDLIESLMEELVKDSAKDLNPSTFPNQRHDTQKTTKTCNNDKGTSRR